MLKDAEFGEEILKHKTRAYASLPCFLEIRESFIPGAGLGIFSTILLSPGVIFGPYEVQMGILLIYQCKLEQYSRDNESKHQSMQLMKITILLIPGL